MPWRFIAIIFVFIVFLVFIGFNLGEDYQSNISFGFKVIENVPVFFTIFISFTVGVLVTLPIVLSGRKKSEPSAPKDKTDKKDKKPKDAENKDAAVALEFDEPAPEYSGGKYFDKNKSKK